MRISACLIFSEAFNPMGGHLRNCCEASCAYEEDRIVDVKGGVLQGRRPLVHGF